MTKFITVTTDADTGEVRVREVLEAVMGTGFIVAPRDDIAPGDILSEEEQMRSGLIPWSTLPVIEEPVTPETPS
jgi:hypothetical protein